MHICTVVLCVCVCVCVCVLTWAGGCSPLQRKSSSERLFRCAEWTWAALQNPAESLRYHNSIRDKIIFAHFSFSQVAVPVGLSSVCNLKRGTGNETETGLWDAADLTLSAEVIYTLCAVRSDNWCVWSFQLSTESSANVCMTAGLDERRSQIVCYSIWTLFRGSQKKKSSYLEKLILWEMKTITNNIVFTFAPIENKSMAVFLWLQKRKNREIDRHLTPKSAIEDPSVNTDTDQWSYISYLETHTSCARFNLISAVCQENVLCLVQLILTRSPINKR